MYRHALSRAVPYASASLHPARVLSLTAGHRATTLRVCVPKRFYTNPPPSGAGSGSNSGPGGNFNPGVPPSDQNTGSQYTKHPRKEDQPSTSGSNSGSGSGSSSSAPGPGKGYNPGVPPSAQSTGSQYVRAPSGSSSAKKAGGAHYSTSAPDGPDSNGTPPPTESVLLRRAKTAVRWTGFLVLSSVVGLAVLGGSIFVHDAFTYNERHVDKVPVLPLALHPETGGPKNLPIARVSMSDNENNEYRKLAEKPKLVILGSGWGAVGVLQKLKPGDYHVTVIAPDTFMTFTPLLPSAAVGTVQVRSLVEPIRKILARFRGHFIEGRAIDISMKDNLVEVESIDPTGKKHNLYIPYDKLVIAVGSGTSTHGVPGLENCFKLKSIRDAQLMRRRIMDNFESASLPTTTPEERKRLLSFVVCGGGPTGVEVAAEIYDLCQEDIINYYPKILREEVSIHVIQSREHILNTYSEAISKFAEDKFRRDGVNLVTSARVSEVTPENVVYTTRSTNGQIEKHEIPSNMVLWSTGIAMQDFTGRMSSLLPNQVHKRAIETDAHLRVKGAPLGEVYAIGDCATIETNLISYFMELVEAADKDKNGKIDFEEWQDMVELIKQRIPMAGNHVAKVRELFVKYDKDKDENLSLNETVTLLQAVSRKITSLPATAQVASQQGKYIGRKLRKSASKQARLPAGSKPMLDEEVMKPFTYTHFGSLAYIGNAAVFDYGKFSFMGGLAAMYAWRSIYWNEQVTFRTRALLMFDWVVRGIWGRDLSKL